MHVSNPRGSVQTAGHSTTATFASTHSTFEMFWFLKLPMWTARALATDTAGKISHGSQMTNHHITFAKPCLPTRGAFKSMPTSMPLVAHLSWILGVENVHQVLDKFCVLNAEVVLNMQQKGFIVVGLLIKPSVDKAHVAFVMF